MLEGLHEFEIRVVALMSELVARETKDGEFVAVLFRQGIQLNEILTVVPHIVATLLISTTLPLS